MAKNFAGVAMNIVEGLMVNAGVTQELVDKIKTMKHYSDDVWIATFPRSGTYWVALG